MASCSNSFEECPVCQNQVPSEGLELHVNQCFEKCSEKFSSLSNKRQSDKTFGIFNCAKKLKVEECKAKEKITTKDEPPAASSSKSSAAKPKPEPPLAEVIRADRFEDYVGQKQAVGENSIIRNLLKSNNIPSMIFWGPPGMSIDFTPGMSIDFKA